MAQMKIATLLTGLVAGCAVMVAVVGGVGQWGTDKLRRWADAMR